MCHGSHAGCEVAVQVERQFHRLFQCLEKWEGIIGGHEPGHVFDTDTVSTHCLQFFSLGDVVVQVVYIATHTGLSHRIADASLEVLAGFFYAFDNGFKIAVIIQGIKGPEYIHAVSSCPLHKGLGNIICIIAVSHKVLGAEQHGKRGFGGIFFKCPDPFPGIFIQKAVHGVKSGATPGFKGPETNFIHQLGNRDHVLGSAPGGKEGLVAVTQGQIHNLDRVFGYWPVLVVIYLGVFYADVDVHCCLPVN